MKIQGKVFVVTGGASGLGAATARHLIEQGAKVILVDMNQALGEELQRELGENAQFKSLDVTDEQAAQSFFQEVEAEYAQHLHPKCWVVMVFMSWRYSKKY